MPAVGGTSRLEARPCSVHLGAKAGEAFAEERLRVTAEAPSQREGPFQEPGSS